jgi:hypothetical protein
MFNGFVHMSDLILVRKNVTLFLQPQAPYFTRQVSGCDIQHPPHDFQVSNLFVTSEGGAWR